jgi:hypothetical protein
MEIAQIDEQAKAPGKDEKSTAGLERIEQH